MISLLVGYIFLQGILIYKLLTDNKMENIIMRVSDNYYKNIDLQALIKKELGSKYTDDMYVNLENYLLVLLSRELTSIGDDSYEKYNRFYSKQEFDNLKMHLEEKQMEDRYESLNNDLFYIKINSFVENKTYKNFYSHIKQLQSSKGLIVDLRDNRGGSVDELIKLLEHFIPKGNILMKERKDDEIVDVISKGKRQIPIPIVILVNKNTASAAEIFAISIRENLEDTIIIGENTFGKGIETNTIINRDGSAFMYISNYWDSPIGNNISGIGIIPDIYIENQEEQLSKAIERLDKAGYR